MRRQHNGSEHAPPAATSAAAVLGEDTIRALRRLASVASLTLILSAGVTTTVTTPAAAHHAGGCGGAATEAELIAQNNAGCRATFVIDPGANNLVSRETLLANEAFYGRHGYTRNFLTWAPVTRISSAGQQWARCDNNGGNNTCADNSIAFGPVSSSFGGHTPDITVYGDADAFIGVVCGNFRPGPGVVDTYTPTITGSKFYDRNRDGLSQPGEQGLGGWRFDLHRVRGDLGQQPGYVATVASGPDGAFSFDVADHGPGVYRVTERLQDGWAVTTPISREITVPAGSGSSSFPIGQWGNVETQADAAKVDFALVDGPSRIDADTPTELTVRVALRNHGPADVIEVRDEVEISSPNPDCTFSPARQSFTTTLREGELLVREVKITALCTEPSDHRFDLFDRLSVTTPGVDDPEQSNNTRAFQHALEVYDKADVAVSDGLLDCPARTDIGVAFRCTGTASVLNNGPYGPADTDVDLSIRPPADCEVTPVGVVSYDDLALPVGEAQTVTGSWDVVCSQRSFHPIELSVVAALDHLHVTEIGVGDEESGAEDVVEVFESADLAVSIVDLQCSEREHTTLASSCTATVAVTNEGPADQVIALATISAKPSADCIASPQTQTVPLTLAAGETSVLTYDVGLGCTSSARHDVLVEASVRADEPHAEDRDLVDNADSARWIPQDVKPRSLPSSVNIGKKGKVPFALLSTAAIDTTTQVDVDSLRFGATGTEDSVIGCAVEGEDVNDDGLLDKVCHADTQLTGITCDTTVTVATGRLVDGTSFTSQDDVNVTPCRT